MLGGDLLQLARETSPDQRNILLQRITDSFFAVETDPHIPENAVFEEMALRVISDLDAPDRARLADHIADAPNAPRQLVLKLARGSIDVARPVLERSPSLADADLVALASEADDERLQAISRRGDLPEMVTDVLLLQGSDTVCRVLSGNGGARFSWAGLSRLMARPRTGTPAAQTGDAVKTAVVRDLAGRLADSLEGSLRARGLMAEGDGGAPLLAELARRLDTTFAEREIETRAVERAVCTVRSGTSTIDEVLIPLAQADRGFDVATVIGELSDIGHDAAMRAVSDTHDEPVMVMLRALDAGWPAAEAVLQLRARRRGGADAPDSRMAATYAAMDLATAQRVLRYLQFRTSVVLNVA